MTFVTHTTDSAATQALGLRLAKLVRGGDVVELSSDLGGGKTTLTQGIAEGLGYTGRVTSPTFTLSQVYELPGGRELHHYDLYRLSEGGIMDLEIGEDVEAANVITVVEWGDVVQDVLPEDRLRIELRLVSEAEREITVSGQGARAAAIIEGLNK